jgi:hypothetical protein
LTVRENVPTSDDLLLVALGGGGVVHVMAATGEHGLGATVDGHGDVAEWDSAA